jgi:OOP family OmpA-OmpF porin
MKKITKLTASIVASFALVGLANAATPGAYAGIGLGSSTLRTPDSYLFNIDNAYSGTNKHQRGGLGGRVFAGYNVNNYFGLEAGYASYASSQYKASADGANASLKYSLDAVSLVGKAYLPIDDSGFNVYALGGLADVRNQVHLQMV